MIISRFALQRRVALRDLSSEIPDARSLVAIANLPFDPIFDTLIFDTLIFDYVFGTCFSPGEPVSNAQL